MATRDVWYCAEDEKPVGPFTLDELREVLSRATNAREILVWGDGFSRWERAEDVGDLTASVIKPPPIRKSDTSTASRQNSSRSKVGKSSPYDAASPDKVTAAEAGYIHYLAENAEKLVQAATGGLWALAALTVAAMLSVLWRIYALSDLQRLVGSYGYGHVPQAMLPANLEFTDYAATIGIWIWSIGLLACVMYCFHQCYLALKGRFNTPFKYSFSLTVGSLFIPILWFVRPWLGLGEIRRKAAAARHGASEKFDFWTPVFALCYFSGIIVIRVIAKQEENLPPTAGVFVSGIVLDVVIMGVIALLSIITFFYCHSLVSNVRVALSKFDV
jgi:GYF domain 2